MNSTIQEDLATVSPNNTTSLAGDDQDCMLFAFITRSILVGIFCFIGLTGNIISFVVFQCDTLKTSTTFLFQSLCVTDSILLICVFPVYSVEHFLIFTEHFNPLISIQPYLYMLFYPCAMIAHTATIWLTVLVGVNRFIAVCIPYKAARLCTVSKAKQYVAIVAFLSILYNLPRFFIYTLHTTKEGNQIATFSDLYLNRIYQVTYEVICYLIFIQFVPLLILSVLNIRLIKTLKDLKRRRSEMQSRQQQQDNNVTLVLVVVVLVFCICQIPALINHILWAILPAEERLCGRFQYFLRHICNLLVVINSSTNVIIYLVFNTRFRTVLLQRCLPGKYGNNGTATCNGASQTLLSKI